MRGLHATVNGIEILKGIDLTVKSGEVHAIMGPNGSGKSTLAKVLAGHPAYEVTGGEVVFEGGDLFELDPEERARARGVPGFSVSGRDSRRVEQLTFCGSPTTRCRRERGKEELDPLEFDDFVREKMKLLEMSPEFLDRSVNDGFSGGEKKRNEILQMAMLDPQLAILDETDSGLDIDALRVVAGGVNQARDAGQRDPAGHALPAAAQLHHAGLRARDGAAASSRPAARNWRWNSNRAATTGSTPNTRPARG